MNPFYPRARVVCKPTLTTATRQNFHYDSNSQTLQRRTCARLLIALAVVTFANAHVATSSAATTVSAIHSHGAIQAHDVPSSYGVFRGALFFSSADRLYRLDSIDAAAAALPLDNELGNGLALRARFTVFDDALFMHARRRNRGNNGYFLHRINNRNASTIDLIDIAEEPETEDYDWIAERGYADDSREFAELDGKLYFFVARAIRPLDFTNLSHALFRLDTAQSVPRQVYWEDYFNAVNPHDLAATSLGIVFTATSPGIARRGHLPQSYVYRIEDPVAANNAAAGYRDFAVASSKRISGRTGGRELIVFNEMIYYTGEHHGLRLIDDFAASGPFPDPGRVKLVEDPWQTELYRHDPSSGNAYFDLNSMSVEMANSALARGEKNIGSSSPDNFVYADGAFFFRARSNGVDAEIYRLRSDDTKPQPLMLNTVATSDTRPLGEFSDQFWFAADGGDGLDLFYLSTSEQTPTALNVGNSIARSARGFTQYGNHVIFSAKGDDDQWWTFAVTMDSRNTIPDEDEPVLSTTLRVNNSDLPTIDVDVDEAVRFNCSVKNITTDALDNVRVVVRQMGAPAGDTKFNTEARGREKYANGNDPSRANHSICKKGRLASGRSVSCRLATVAVAGDHRFACVGSITTGVDTQVRSAARTIVRGTPLIEKKK